MYLEKQLDYIIWKGHRYVYMFHNILDTTCKLKIKCHNVSTKTYTKWAKGLAACVIIFSKECA